jgi:hypothetical protein
MLLSKILPRYFTWLTKGIFSLFSVRWASGGVVYIESELLYDWRFTANQFVLAPSPLRLKTSIFFQLYICDHSPYVKYSLTRGWVCLLQLLLVIASAVILRSESLGTHDHILLSQIWDSPKLEGKVPVFISPRNMVAQLYLQALGSFLIASYNP